MTETAFETKYTAGSGDAGSACYRCQEEKPMPGNFRVKIRVAVFFDGTLNNRNNSEQGEKGILKDDSYKDPITNIGILARYFQESSDYDYSFSVYVEGIGTEDDKTDSLKGYAFGQGPTGVEAKVEIGITRLIEKINLRFSKHEVIEYLYLDCFGFSRGAAAARNFIHAAILRSKDTLKDRLQSKGHLVKEVKVKFVGLFDTVSSHGLVYGNDTNDLHLDSIMHAEDILQLAASEEHRKYFALTNINSAPHGVQLFLPGAHSDIGGGYRHNMDEVDYQVMFIWQQQGDIELNDFEKAAYAREKEWLLTSGWYHEDEIQKMDQWKGLKVTRRGISNHFHRIPLKMMAEFAAAKGINFAPLMMIKYAISPSLHKVETFIRNSPLSSPEFWLDLKTDMMKNLRHDYLHFSACFGSLMDSNYPQFTNNDIITGRRKREVLNG